MTTTPFEPSHDDPSLRPDLASDGTPTPAPGLDARRPDDVPVDPNDAAEPRAEQS